MSSPMGCKPGAISVTVVVPSVGTDILPVDVVPVEVTDQRAQR